MGPRGVSAYRDQSRQPLSIWQGPSPGLESDSQSASCMVREISRLQTHPNCGKKAGGIVLFRGLPGLWGMRMGPPLHAMDRIRSTISILLSDKSILPYEKQLSHQKQTSREVQSRSESFSERKTLIGNNYPPVRCKQRRLLCLRSVRSSVESCCQA